MAITGIPVFEDGEIPSAGKLNQLGVAITTKFAGAVEPGDFTWPFVVQGNIDFDDTYGIVNLRTFWNLFNAAEYATLQAAVDAAEAAGGGTVFIPPGTAITADGVSIDESNIAIIGAGKKSQIKLTSSSSSGFLFRSGTASLTNIVISNLVLDGQSTGSAQKGVIMRRVTNFEMRNVTLKNFTGAGVDLTNDGTPGNACVDARIIDNFFSGGSSSHVIGSDIDGLQLVGNKSVLAGAANIALEPGTAAGLIKRIQVLDNDIEGNSAGAGISILGASGTPSDNWSIIKVSDNTVTGTVSDSLLIGTTSKILKNATVRDNDAPSSGADALKFNASIGRVANNHFPAATGDGIDLIDSVDVVVTGNNCRDAAATGIDCNGTTTCEVFGNNVQDCVTPILATSSTSLRLGVNYGAHGGAPATVVYDGTSYTRTTNGDFAYTATIPGGVVKVGDRITVRAHIAKTGTAETAAITLKVGGTSIISTGTIPATPASDYIAQWDIFPVAVSADTSAILSIAGTGYTFANKNETININWAVDNAFTFTLVVSGGTNTIGLRHVSITIEGAK